MSQQSLAEAVGLTFQQIQKYEHGSNRISSSKLYEVAMALAAPVSHFFDGLPDPASGDEPKAVPAADGSIHAFLMMPDGHELAALFPQISRGKVRRRVLEMLRALAEDGSDA